MLESMLDLLSQRQRLETAATQQPQVADPAVQPVVFKKPLKPLRRLSKKEISAPCNFKHVSGMPLAITRCTVSRRWVIRQSCDSHCDSRARASPSRRWVIRQSCDSHSAAGITMQRTQSCEQELSGTIQRKMRSLSLSNLYRHKARGGSHGSHCGCGETGDMSCDCSLPTQMREASREMGQGRRRQPVGGHQRRGSRLRGNLARCVCSTSTQVCHFVIIRTTLICALLNFTGLSR